MNISKKKTVETITNRFQELIQNIPEQDLYRIYPIVYDSLENKGLVPVLIEMDFEDMKRAVDL